MAFFVSWIRSYICCTLSLHNKCMRALHIKSVVHYAALSIASHCIVFQHCRHIPLFSLSHCMNDFVYLISAQMHTYFTHKSSNKKAQTHTHTATYNLNSTRTSPFMIMTMYDWFNTIFFYPQFYVCHSGFYWHCVIKWVIFILVAREKRSRCFCCCCRC